MKTIYPVLCVVVAIVVGGARWNSPVATAPPARPMTYAFDQSFLHYFGHEGTMRVHSAVQRALNKGLLDREQISREVERDTTLQAELRLRGERDSFGLLPEFME